MSETNSLEDLRSLNPAEFTARVDAFYKGMQTKLGHDKPSDDTLRMFKEFGDKMDEGFNKLHEKINGLKDEFVPRRECSLIHGRTEDEINLIVSSAVEAVMGKCDNRYATKLTQNIVLGMCGLILISFITTLTVGWPVKIPEKGVSYVSEHR